MSEADNIAPNIWAAAAIGIAAGLIASFIMDRVQGVLPAPDTGDADPATVVTAKHLHKQATGDALKEKHKAVAGSLVHYGLGGALGAAYGVAAEYWPAVTRGAGVPFGLSVAIMLDEMLVPAVGITKPPWRYGAGTHAYSLVSHAVFGASIEASRRSLRAIGPSAS